MEYDPLEYALDQLYEARALWERGDYLIAPHSVGMLAVDEALDHYNDLRRDIQDFERVFGNEFPRLPDGR
jgi:hypothetical protein